MYAVSRVVIDLFSCFGGRFQHISSVVFSATNVEQVNSKKLLSIYCHVSPLNAVNCLHWVMTVGPLLNVSGILYVMDIIYMVCVARFHPILCPSLSGLLP